MADSNISAVSIVAIIAIVLLVGAGLYLVWTRQGGEERPMMDMDIEESPMNYEFEGPSERTESRFVLAVG
jgi:hypothetical protein